MPKPSDSVMSARRSFLRGAGAIAAALLPGVAATAQASNASLASDDEAAIRKLYQDHVASLASTGAEAPLRVLHDAAQPADSIVIAPDGQSARACFHCLAQRATPLVGNSTLLAMARLQGQYSDTHWEAGLHELECVKADGRWRIRRFAFRRRDAVDFG